MKQYAVIGIGRFGLSVAKTLYSMGHDVLAVDKDHDRIQEIYHYVTHAVEADSTDEDALKALGLRNFDAVVITIGSDIQSSILTTLLCKEMGVKFIVGKAHNELHAKVLYKIGVDKVIFPERDMGMKLAHSLASYNILDHIELASEYSLVELSAISEWEGKSLRHIDMRRRFGLNVVAIKRGQDILISPKGDDIINRDDILVVIGRNNDIRRLGNKT